MTSKYNYLSDEDINLFESRGTISTYSAGEIILSERSESHKVFWIRKGTVRIEHNRLYQNVVVAGVGAGEMFGEIAYLTGDRATANVVCNGEIEVLVLDPEVMDELLAADDALASRFYRTAAVTLAKRLRRQSHSC